jgi:uncharacterized protein (TIGR03435 family)
MCRGCFAQSSPPGHFEVASVKHSAQKEWGRFRGGPGSKDPERVTYESTPLENLIRDAYHFIALSDLRSAMAEYRVLTPKAMLAGLQAEIHAERDRKLEAPRKQRQLRRQQARREERRARVQGRD